MKRAMYLCALLAVIGCKKQEDQGATGNQMGSGSPTSGTYTSTNPSAGTTGSMGATGSSGSMGSADTTGSAGTMSGSATAASSGRARVSLTPTRSSKIAGTIELSDLGNGVAVRADLRNAPNSTLSMAVVDGCAAGNSVIAKMGQLDVDADGTVSFTTSMQDQSLSGTGSQSLMGKSVAIRDANGTDVACGSISSDPGSSGTTTGGTQGE